jgi:hypothetical protein
VQNNISFVSRLLWLKDEVSYFEEGINWSVWQQSAQENIGTFPDEPNNLGYYIMRSFSI